MDDNDPRDDLLDDPRLMQAVQEYLARIESGQVPAREELLRRYADLAEPLAECLDGLELVHQAATSDTQLPGGRGPATGSSGESPAAPLGDYQILREIGRGGMGIVYEAVQLSLGRRVALKVLPFAAALDARHLQRFQNEAQAAARLHHTNIVPVHAVGCERGVHYYAMQLIEGQSLAELVAQLRRAAGKRTRDAWDTASDPLSDEVRESTSPLARAETVARLSVSLSTQHTGKRHEFFRSAARFMVQAADALEYAHQMGIVHRDIKPGNLLVDARGRLWITDFGLAQFHVDAGLTQTGDVLGTLRYMSPEQAEGRTAVLDHHTDIYALGATLYELATLEPLFAGGNRQELLQQVIHDEPKSPRSLEKAIPVDLETIILKAVSKDPRDRYATAAEMSADLGRFLEDKPILARRPTLVQRARKWSRRHPSVLATGVLVLLVCLVGLLVYNRSIAAEQANTARRAVEAEEQYRIARSHVDNMVQITEEETADDPRMLAIRKRLLEAALVYYQKFIEQRREDPAAQAELSATRDRVRKILDDLALLQGVGQFFLLSERAVLDDLKLSAGQRGEVEALNKQLADERQETFRDFHQITAEQRTERFLELARSQEAAMESVLTPEQIARLRQIALQCQGPMAFREQEIATALALTSEQKERIRAIEAETMFGRPPEGWGPGGRGPDGRGPGGRGQGGRPPGGRGPGDPGRDEADGPPRDRPQPPDRDGPAERFAPAERGEGFGGPRVRPPEQQRAAAMAQILALLSQEQQAAWHRLIGPAYQGPVMMFFPGPPRGGPRGPDRGPPRGPQG